jgi:hypothetical protein
LRYAQGNVRCGVCATSFNALENLSEEPFRSDPDGNRLVPPEDTITVEELPGNENIELSTAGEAVSASEVAPGAQNVDSAAAEEPSLEFDGDIEDLDRLFVELPDAELQHMAAAARSGELQPASTIDPGAVAASLTIRDDDETKILSRKDRQFAVDPDPTDEYPIIVLGDADESDESPPAERKVRSTGIPIPVEMQEGLAQEAAARDSSLLEFDEPAAEPGRRRWPWALGAAILALGLGGQIVHGQRQELVHKPGIGPLLAGIYSMAGTPITVPTDLAAYELRQWGAASDARHPGRLLVRASIVNRASHTQPYPLLRLALQDRFGTIIGVRDIEPADYLPGAGAVQQLEPGQRTDAEIRIVDPGKDAVGFEIDVCLPITGDVRCANEGRPAGS